MWRLCINVVIILAVPVVMSLPTYQFKDYSKDNSSTLFENSGVKDETLIEGDILVSNRNTFNAIVNKLSKWPNGWVPSVIQKVKEMHTMLNNSCIHFYTRRPWEADYLYFAEYKGCYSWTGMIGGKQTISIGKNCCSRSTIQHQMMHALGFYHEHNRPDRDNYVQINWHNIQSGNDKLQFKISSMKCSISRYNSVGQELNFGM
ncbi:Uncharacterised protein r2_g2790 [Pycnogonum litorale]